MKNKKIILALLGLLCMVLLNSAFPQATYFYNAKGEKIIIEENSTVKYICFQKQSTPSSFFSELSYLCDFEIDSINDILRCIDIKQPIAFENFCSNYSEHLCFVSSEFVKHKTSTTIFPSNKIFIQTQNLDTIRFILKKNGVYYKNIEVVNSRTKEYIVSIGVSENTLKWANLFFEKGLAAYAQPDFFYKNFFANPLYPFQWGEKNTGQYCDTLGFDINVENAWTITKGDPTIVVALLDMGVDLNHEDLQNNVLPGKSMLSNTNGQETMADWHGTTCAGIIIAEDNNVGIVGVAPQTHLLPIKTGNSYHISDYNLCAAFQYLIDSTNASIASCSWGGTYNECLKNTIMQFINNGRNGKGGIVVFAAGNHGGDEILSPGLHLPDCITVGALCPNGTRKDSTSCIEGEWASCYGNGLCVMAPGVMIPTTIRITNVDQFTYAGDKYILDFGMTSAACPPVAGVAALVLSINPNLSGRKVKEIIERSCTKVRQDIYSYDSLAPHGAWDYEMGYGLVNAYQAVLMAQGCKDYPYCTIDTIRGNASWNSPITAGDTLVIDSLSTLTISDTVAFYSEGLIIVRPGGKLIVNGGTLTSACEGEMCEKRKTEI